MSENGGFYASECDHMDQINKKTTLETYKASG